jgi:hypothetical protein
MLPTARALAPLMLCFIITSISAGSIAIPLSELPEMPYPVRVSSSFQQAYSHQETVTNPPPNTLYEFLKCLNHPLTVSIVSHYDSLLSQTNKPLIASIASIASTAERTLLAYWEHLSVHRGYFTESPLRHDPPKAQILAKLHFYINTESSNVCLVPSYDQQNSNLESSKAQTLDMPAFLLKTTAGRICNAQKLAARNEAPQSLVVSDRSDPNNDQQTEKMFRKTNPICKALKLAAKKEAALALIEIEIIIPVTSKNKKPLLAFKVCLGIACSFGIATMLLLQILEDTKPPRRIKHHERRSSWNLQEEAPSGIENKAKIPDKCIPEVSMYLPFLL